uniref:EF-hand domain-containing protein n=1 Tax=Spongospora subterranea TaxID=70186 RepID=A0A0H5RDA2_9EUKA|eukprot:CRZ11973.1 hypothetical protein [Spongospora subterranea]
MRCALCESKHDLHRLMPPGRCDDCTMATPFSDQLCLDCSTKTTRCQTCKSSKVEHGDASDLSQQPDISSDIPRQSPTSMLKMDLLRAVFIRYTNPDSNCISQTQFRKLVSQLPLSNRTAAIVKADLAFLQVRAGRHSGYLSNSHSECCQVATVRGRNLQFLEFVNAIGRFSKSIYRASLAHSLDSICNNCLSSMLLTGANTMESPPGGHAAVADLLAQNRQVLKCVYVDACGSSLRLTLDGFMSFCRSTGILPEVATVAELKHVFLGCRG